MEQVPMFLQPDLSESPSDALSVCVSLPLSLVSLGHFQRLPNSGGYPACLCLWVSVSPSLPSSVQFHICPPCLGPCFSSSHTRTCLVLAPLFFDRFTPGKSRPILVPDTSHFLSLSFPCPLSSPSFHVPHNLVTPILLPLSLHHPFFSFSLKITSHFLL